MTDAVIIQTLIGMLIGLLGFFGYTISKKLDRVQADVNSIAVNHGQRLTSLETKAEIMRQGAMHGNG